jgi:hypothetical protein
MHRHPAAFADSMPFAASSKTTHDSAGTFSAEDAFKRIGMRLSDFHIVARDHGRKEVIQDKLVQY